MRYVICINNTDYPTSLELRKLYQVVDDAGAEADGLLRVIDESGEDYLFEADRFMPIELPAEIQEAMSKMPA
jgi:hypothetical protein